MTNREEVLYADVAAAIGLPAKRKVSLRSLSPTDLEVFARWIENYFGKLPARIAEAESALRAGIEPRGLREQIYYWRVACAVGKHMAYTLRTRRGGPLGGDLSKTKDN